eukprot:TRINITY_DN5117_c0_g3_i1.p1 TRINITY_DN5117_c0_g3~~TRINITY_DN5117_c0_g3_i1.p1  ORF type:complete len:416 (+),score=81.27 TRINITY_DN5117_c0_g3_i1:795-2042(+)
MFHVTWEYLFRGLIPTVGHVIIFPIVVLMNIFFSSFAFLCVPLWVPLSTLSQYVGYRFIYDPESPKTSQMLLRVPKVVLSTLCLGFGQIFAACVATILYHPVMYVAWITFTVFRYMFRSVLDVCIFPLFKKYGRIPSKNGRLARRVKGPGLGYSYSFVIEPELALLILQAHLEKSEMKEYLHDVSHLIAEPQLLLLHNHKNLFSHFGSLPNLHSPLYEQVIFRNQQIEKEIEEKLSQQKANSFLKGNIYQLSNIKQTPENQQKTFLRAYRMISRWYPQHVFAYMTESEVDRFWAKKKLSEDNWWGLTEKILEDIFTSDFLTPLEVADEGLSITVTNKLSKDLMRHLYSDLFRKGEDTTAVGKEDFELLQPQFKPFKVLVEDLYEVVPAIQRTIEPWSFGINTLKDINLTDSTETE